MAAPYKDFASRLHQALDRAGFEAGRKRAGALADRYAISDQGVRKWLAGHSLPELPRLIQLAIDFDVSFEWLATGRGQAELGVREAPAEFQRLTSHEGRMLEIFRKMPEPKRRLLVDLFS